MSEKIPTSQPVEAPPTAEEIEREENERYEWWMANHPVVEVRAEESPEAQAEKEATEECEGLMSDFEQAYDLEALRAITQFSSREERQNSIRQPALDALSSMFQRMKELSDQGALQRETRDVLGARYEKLSQAVGNITVDKDGKIFDVVVHDRRTPFPGDRLS